MTSCNTRTTFYWCMCCKIAAPLVTTQNKSRNSLDSTSLIPAPVVAARHLLSSQTTLQPRLQAEPKGSPSLALCHAACLCAGVLAVKRVDGVPTVFPADSGEVSPQEDLLQVWQRAQQCKSLLPRWPLTPASLTHTGGLPPGLQVRQSLTHCAQLAVGHTCNTSADVILSVGHLVLNRTDYLLFAHLLSHLLTFLLLQVVYDKGPMQSHAFEDFDALRQRVATEWQALPRTASIYSASLQAKLHDISKEHTSGAQGPKGQQQQQPVAASGISSSCAGS